MVLIIWDSGYVDLLKSKVIILPIVIFYKVVSSILHKVFIFYFMFLCVFTLIHLKAWSEHMYALFWFYVLKAFKGGGGEFWLLTRKEVNLCLCVYKLEYQNKFEILNFSGIVQQN